MPEKHTVGKIVSGRGQPPAPFNVLKPRPGFVCDEHAICHACQVRKHVEDFDWITKAFHWRGRVGLSAQARRAVFLHRACRDCRFKAKAQWARHPLYSPSLEAFWEKRLQGVMNGAHARSIIFAIDKDDLIEMFLKQDGKCALSGLELNLREKGAAARGQRALLQPSVDRIDSAGNYTLDNIQIVALAINLMKGDLGADNFVRLCRSVVRSDRERKLAREASVSDIVEALC
jgi:hypothetical protein